MALISIALYESLKGAINATPPRAAQKKLQDVLEALSNPLKKENAL